MAAISLVEDSTASPAAVAALDRVVEGRGYASDLHRALAHVPDALDAFEQFSAQIRSGPLAAGLRELATLRVSQLLGNEYEWRRHVPAGVREGLRPEQIAELWRWNSSAEFGNAERAVLRFVDEHLHQEDITAEAVDALCVHLAEPEIVALCLTVGWYLLVSSVILPLRLIEDDDTPEVTIAPIGGEVSRVRGVIDETRS